MNINDPVGARAIVIKDWKIFYAKMIGFVDESVEMDARNARRVKIDLKKLNVAFITGAEKSSFTRQLVEHLSEFKKNAKHLLQLSMIFIPKLFDAHVTPLDVLKLFDHNTEIRQGIKSALEAHIIESLYIVIDGPSIADSERSEIRRHPSIRSLENGDSSSHEAAETNAQMLTTLHEKQKSIFKAIWEVA